ncbi:hypothetical protein ACOSQ3_017071 [Xanthoceras sorbifolium]
MIPVNVLPPLATKFELQLRSLVIVECFLLENGWPWLLAGTCYYTKMKLLLWFYVLSSQMCDIKHKPSSFCVEVEVRWFLVGCYLQSA